MLLTVLPLAAARPAIDLMAGLRESDDVLDGQPVGARVGARLAPRGRLAVEAALSVRLPGEEMSGLTQDLVAGAYYGNQSTTFRQPVARELGSLGVYAAFSPWEQPAERDVGIWVYGLGGAELRLAEYDYASVNPAYADGDPGADPAVLSEDPATGLTGGPALGLGVDLWFHGRVGVRVGGVERAWIGTEPDYGNLLPDGSPEPLESRLYTSGTAFLDLMVRL